MEHVANLVCDLDEEKRVSIDLPPHSLCKNQFWAPLIYTFNHQKMSFLVNAILLVVLMLVLILWFYVQACLKKKKKNQPSVDETKSCEMSLMKATNVPV